MQGLLLLFLNKRDDFANKNEEFCNPNIKTILATINEMPHELFATGLQARDIYPESNVSWEEFLTIKFGFFIDTCSSTDNTLHGSSITIEKSGILLQIEKVPKSSNGDLTCHVFSLEDTVAHLSFTNPSSILTIEN